MTIFNALPHITAAVLRAVLAAGFLGAAWQAQAQPLSVVVKPALDSVTWLDVSWQPPASGTVTEYLYRVAPAAGSTAWLNASGVTEFSAGTATKVVIKGLASGQRHDVQIGAVVSGATTWSVSVGGIPGRGFLASLALTASDGQAITLAPAFSTDEITYTASVEAGVTGFMATATTIGNGEFGVLRTAPVDRRAPAELVVSASSGGTLAVVALAAGANRFSVGALQDDGMVPVAASTIVRAHVLIITRATPAAPAGKPALVLAARAMSLRADWNAPGGDLVESYEITWRTSDPDGGGAMTAGAWQDASGDDADCAAADDPGAANGCGANAGTALTYNIMDLSNGDGYDVRVRAVNVGGNGPWSDAQSATPAAATAPGAPANPAANAGVRRITVNWGAPASDGGDDITSYRVRWRLSAGAGAWQDAGGDDAECNDNDAANDAMCGVEAAADATSYTITGLMEGVSYDAAIAAVNSAGAGAWSGDTAAQAAPRAPDPLAFTSAPPARLSFSFNAAETETLPAASGGVGAISYSLAGDALPAGLSFTAATRVLAGMPADVGIFQIVYQATDEAGAGGDAAGILRADFSLEVAIAAAAAPADLTATPANARLRLAWSAPSGNDAGGQLPSGYRVRWSAGSGTSNWNDDDGIATGSDKPSHNLEGLTNGTIYAVQVAAVNSAGIGDWSGSVEAAPADVLAFLSQQEDLFVRLNKAVTAVLPEAEQGGTPYTYEVSALPNGLTFDKDARTISGSPGATVAPAKEITYTVTDNDGATDMQSFTIRQVTFDLDLDTADDDGAAAATVQDGIITARYLLGVRGAALLRGQSNGSISGHEAALKTGVDSKALDVDGSGAADGDDGILIVRHLLGLRGDELFDGFADANRNEVLGNIVELLPGGS